MVGVLKPSIFARLPKVVWALLCVKIMLAGTVYFGWAEATVWISALGVLVFLPRGWLFEKGATQVATLVFSAMCLGLVFHPHAPQAVAEALYNLGDRVATSFESGIEATPEWVTRLALAWQD